MSSHVCLLDWKLNQLEHPIPLCLLLFPLTRCFLPQASKFHSMNGFAGGRSENTAANKATECTCPKGHYEDGIYCTPCEYGEYLDGAACAACPDNMITLRKGKIAFTRVDSCAALFSSTSYVGHRGLRLHTSVTVALDCIRRSPWP